MHLCEYCETPTEADWDYCSQCGCNLWLQASRFPRQWTDTVPESKSLHWLAQAQRRLVMPIEPTEEIPFLAFEYAWKVVNRLYNSLSIPKVLIPETGKERDATAKESTLHLFKELDATSKVIEENRLDIRKLCDCVLEVSDPEYLPGKRGFITFDESPPEEAGELRKSAVEKCERLAKAVTASNYEEASEALVETLLSVRNARVHAAFLKPGARSNVGGEPVTVRTTVGRRDYEIQIVAKILLSIGKILISKKTSRPLTEITELVDSRTCQLLKEIYKRVTAWGPQNRDFGPFNIV
jgi:hypothetical protein